MNYMCLGKNASWVSMGIGEDAQWHPRHFHILGNVLVHNLFIFSIFFATIFENYLRSLEKSHTNSWLH